MEETKSEQAPKPSDPTTQENPQTQPPPPPPSFSDATATATATATAARPPTHPKKRKLDNVDTHYRKLRGLVKSLRPHFIEVLHTPDFRSSQAAHEIRKKMKRLMDVYKQMAVETASIEMSKKQSEDQSLPGEHKDGQKNIDKNHEEKQGKQHHSERGPEKSLEPSLEVNDSVKSEDGKLTSSYVVGGSNLGWNFIMYPGGKAVFYGVTKEARRSSKEKMNAPSKSK